MSTIPCPDCGGSGFKPVLVNKAGESVYVSRKCGACNGFGERDLPDDNSIPCPVCKGSKVAYYPSDWDLDKIGHWSTVGHVKEPCPACEGAGAVPYEEKK